MAIHFNHTILLARDSEASATFLAEMLGLPAPRQWGPFYMVTTENGANLDYMNADGDITPHHIAFLISETEFDEILGRIRGRDLPHWADPAQTQLGAINNHDGGRSRVRTRLGRDAASGRRWLSRGGERVLTTLAGCFQHLGDDLQRPRGDADDR